MTSTTTSKPNTITLTGLCAFIGPTTTTPEIVARVLAELAEGRTAQLGRFACFNGSSKGWGVKLDEPYPDFYVSSFDAASALVRAWIAL